MLLKLASLTDFMLYCIIFTICCVGLDTQIQEIKESVELPLTHPEYYEEMGIKPPKGVILYGPPGTGKTLLAKAVANQTSATFLRVVGSELIQKYLVSLCVAIVHHTLNVIWYRLWADCSLVMHLVLCVHTGSWQYWPSSLQIFHALPLSFLVWCRQYNNFRSWL